MIEGSDVHALIDAELARQSVTYDAVKRAIEWMEIEKESAQNSWERAGAEWRMQLGVQEMHDEQMAAFDLAITALCQMTQPTDEAPTVGDMNDYALRQMRTEPCEWVVDKWRDGWGNKRQCYVCPDCLKASAVKSKHCPNCGRKLLKPPESEVRATPVSGDSPIEVRCQSCGCPVVLHQLYEDGVQVGEHIDCACGYKRQLGQGKRAGDK